MQWVMMQLNGWTHESNKIEGGRDMIAIIRGVRTPAEILHSAPRRLHLSTAGGMVDNYKAA